jgi:hypothetical protein
MPNGFTPVSRVAVAKQADQLEWIEEKSVVGDGLRIEVAETGSYAFTQMTELYGWHVADIDTRGDRMHVTLMPITRVEVDAEKIE